MTAAGGVLPLAGDGRFHGAAKMAINASPAARAMIGARREWRRFVVWVTAAPARCFRFDFTAADKVTEDPLVSIRFPAASPGFRDGLQPLAGNGIFGIDAHRALQVKFSLSQIAFLK